jgi:hypothetical protein
VNQEKDRTEFLKRLLNLVEEFSPVLTPEVIVVCIASILKQLLALNIFGTEKSEVRRAVLKVIGRF